MAAQRSLEFGGSSESGSELSRNLLCGLRLDGTDIAAVGEIGPRFPICLRRLTPPNLESERWLARTRSEVTQRITDRKKESRLHCVRRRDFVSLQAENWLGREPRLNLDAEVRAAPQSALGFRFARDWGESGRCLSRRKPGPVSRGVRGTCGFRVLVREPDAGWLLDRDLRCWATVRSRHVLASPGWVAVAGSRNSWSRTAIPSTCSRRTGSGRCRALRGTGVGCAAGVRGASGRLTDGGVRAVRAVGDCSFRPSTGAAAACSLLKTAEALSDLARMSCRSRYRSRTGGGSSSRYRPYRVRRPIAKRESSCSDDQTDSCSSQTVIRGGLRRTNSRSTRSRGSTGGATVRWTGFPLSFSSTSRISLVLSLRTFEWIVEPGGAPWVLAEAHRGVGSWKRWGSPSTAYRRLSRRPTDSSAIPGRRTCSSQRPARRKARRAAAFLAGQVF